MKDDKKDNKNSKFEQNNTITKELCLLNDDKIIEYKDKVQTDISLFEKLLKTNDFCRSQTKETVLDEDDYLAYLEEIITRDYFPEMYQIKKFNIKVFKF
jgi:hypothetical protein